MKKIPRKPCEVCGQPCKRHTTRFCSIQCRDIWQRPLYDAGMHFGGPSKILTLPRKCLLCNKIFEPHNGKQKFCSLKCGGLSHKEQTRQLGIRGRGRKLSEEHKRKMSIAASKRMANRVYTKGVGGTRSDLGFYCRSRWEANIARLLKYENISFTYEPCIFVLNFNNKEIRYIPDFQINGRHYIEIKGWWNNRSLLVKQLMQEQYPSIQIEYIGESEYNELQQYYRPFVKQWETKGGPKDVQA